MGRRRVLAGQAMVLVLILFGCTYADREPGLLGRSTPTPTTEATTRLNPDLPVVGDAI